MRAIRSSEGLFALGKHLPSEAAEALVLAGRRRLSRGGARLPGRERRSGRGQGNSGRCLARDFNSWPGAISPSSGSTVESGKRVDTTDLAAALQHPDSRRRFVTIHTDEELSSILDAPLEKWRVFLHPSQEKLVGQVVQRPRPSHRRGGARARPSWRCTGLAIWPARSARPRRTRSCSRLTRRTSPKDVGRNLAQLCGPEADRIEVVHLHAWAARFLRDQGRKFEVASPSELDACWEEAIRASGEREFDLGFLRQEWEQVVQANEIETAADYLKVPRIGRGRTLSRVQRQRVWKVGERLRRGPAPARQGRVERHHPGCPEPARTEEAALTLSGRRGGRGPGLPRRGMAAAASDRPARPERPVPRRGRPPAALRSQGYPAVLRNPGAGPVEPIADQLPHDRGDPGVGDDDAVGCRDRRPGRRQGGGEGLQVPA